METVSDGRFEQKQQDVILLPEGNSLKRQDGFVQGDKGLLGFTLPKISTIMPFSRASYKA